MDIRFLFLRLLCLRCLLILSVFRLFFSEACKRTRELIKWCSLRTACCAHHIHSLELDIHEILSCKLISIIHDGNSHVVTVDSNRYRIHSRGSVARDTRIYLCDRKSVLHRLIAVNENLERRLTFSKAVINFSYALLSTHDLTYISTKPLKFSVIITWDVDTYTGASRECRSISHGTSGWTILGMFSCSSGKWFCKHVRSGDTHYCICKLLYDLWYRCRHHRIVCLQISSEYGKKSRYKYGRSKNLKA